MRRDGRGGDEREENSFYSSSDVCLCFLLLFAGAFVLSLSSSSKK